VVRTVVALGAGVVTAGLTTGAPKELTIEDFIWRGVTLTVETVVVTGAFVVTGALVVTGAFEVTGALVVTGAFVVTGALVVTGAAVVTGAFVVTGAAVVAITAAGTTTAPLRGASAVFGFSVKISTNFTSSGFSAGRGFLPGW